MSGLVWEPSLKPLVRALVHANLGTVKSPGSGGLHQRYADRFVFELQHQGSTLSWHFIFDGSRPFLPPEVVLEPRGFDPVASDPSIATLLDTWMVTDETALVRLVTAMRQALAGHAGKLARGVACPRVQFEMETLSSTPNVDISALPPIAAKNVGVSRAIVIALPFHSPAFRDLAFYCRGANTDDARSPHPPEGPAGAAGVWGTPPNFEAPPWVEGFRLSATFVLGPGDQCSGEVPCRIVPPEGCHPGMVTMMADFKVPAMPEGTCLVEHTREGVAGALVSFARSQIGAFRRAAPLFDALARRMRIKTGDPTTWPGCAATTSASFTYQHASGFYDVSVVASHSFPASPPALSISRPEGSPVYYIGEGELAPWGQAWPLDRQANTIMDVIAQRIAITPPR